MKGDRYGTSNWDFRDIEFSKNYICVAIKDRLSSSMQDELEDNQEYYRSLAHDNWCDLLSTINVKDNRKMSETQIKSIETSSAASNSDIHESVRLTCKKMVRTGVLPKRKQQEKKTTKYHVIHCYLALCKKAGMPERKYMSHSSENCFGKCSDHNSIN